MLHIKKIKPLNTNLVVTGHRYTQDVVKNGIIVASKGDLKTNQEVVSVGSMVRDIHVGDKVVFNPMNYAEMKHDPNSIKKDMDIMNTVVKWHLPWVTVENEKGEPQDYLLLTDRDISYVYEGEETEEVLVVPKKKILVN